MFDDVCCRELDDPIECRVEKVSGAFLDARSTCGS